MPSKAKPTSLKSLPNLKKKLSTLVQEAPFRGFTKKFIKPTADAQLQPAPKECEAPPPVKVRESLLGDVVFGDFKPFDIDLSTLESFHLSDNWLDDQRKDQASPTPIADTFTRNSCQIERTSRSELEQFGCNPVDLPAIETRAENAQLGRFSIDAKMSHAAATRNFPTREPLNRQARPDQLREAGPSRTYAVQSQLVNPNETTKITPRHEVKTVSLLKPVGSSENPTARNVAETIERLNLSKRHSMPPSIPGELANRRSVADIKDSLAQRSVSSLQERRLSLQPASLAAAPPASSSSQAIVGRTSNRLSDRLTWIKELEEGKNSSKNPGRDYVLKNIQGGVADKLAKFEGKQLTGGLTRTNSTISRISSVDAYGIESSHASMTTRTSTVDTSNRASSVFTNFDDSFRGKMEMLAGTLADRAQEDSSTKERPPNKVTSKFVPVTATTSNSGETTMLPQEVIDFATLSDGDPETVINDITEHGNLGRTLTWNGSDVAQQLNDAANRALTELPPSHTNNHPCSTEKKSILAPIPIQVDSPPCKSKASDLEQKPNYPATPGKSEGGAETVESPTMPSFNPAALPLFV